MSTPSDQLQNVSPLGGCECRPGLAAPKLGDTRKIKTDGLVNIQKAGWADVHRLLWAGEVQRAGLLLGKETPLDCEGPELTFPTSPAQSNITRANCNKMIMMFIMAARTACRTSLRSTTGPTGR